MVYKCAGCAKKDKDIAYLKAKIDRLEGELEEAEQQHENYVEEHTPQFRDESRD